MGVTVEPVGDTLHWTDMNICGSKLPADHIGRGRHIRLVMNNQMQYAMLDKFFPQTPQKIQHAAIWLQHGKKRLAAGKPRFCLRVGSMIRRRGFLANLSMRENLLLPFLYHDNSLLLQKALAEVDEVADFLGLTSLLYVQAGERSSYTHALLSLGHCLLQHPDVIVAQEVHVGMSPEHLLIFRQKAQEAIRQLGSGVLYLTSSEHEGSGLEFSRTYEIECDNVPDVGDIW